MPRQNGPAWSCPQATSQKALAAAGFSALLLSGCLQTPAAAPARRPAAPPVVAPTPAPNVAGDPANGRALIVARGCAGCHTVPGVAGAFGIVGPNLNNISLRPTLAGEAIPNTPENMAHWLMDPPAMKAGTAMPKLGLSEQEAQDITAFLYSQPYNPRR